MFRLALIALIVTFTGPLGCKRPPAGSPARRPAGRHAVEAGWFSGTAVVTSRNDNARTGATLGERALTVASVGSGQFQKIGVFPVQGQVYAQPLYVPHVPQPDGTVRNLLVVATMHDMLYLFDADAPLKAPGTPPVPLLAQSLGTPLPFNYMPMALANFMLGSGVITIPNLAPKDPKLYNIYPEIGITSTPVVDTVTMRVYVVAKVQTAPGVVALQLWAVDLATHSVVTGSPVTLAASVPGTGAGSSGGVLTFNAKFANQRAALLLSQGSVYIASGSHQDTPPFHGWVLRYDAATLKQTGVWCATPDGEGGSIWHAGGGLAADDQGRIYGIASNGLLPTDITKPTNHAQSFVQFSPSLALLAKFVPYDAVAKSKLDVDLGSSGPVVLPGTRMVIGGGKDGTLFLLDGDSALGLRQFFQASKKREAVNVFGFGFHHLHGSPVVWRPGAGRTLVYLWAERDRMRVFQYDSGAGRFAPQVPVAVSVVVAPVGAGPVPISMPGGILSLSAYGSRPGSALIWASIPTKDDAMHAVVAGTLRVFNAADVTQELWNSERNATRDRVGLFAKFTPPTIANGRVFLATFSNAVLLYGLRQWATFVSQSPVPATLKPGDRFTAHVTVANTGAETWTAAGGYALGLDAPRDSTTWGTNRIPLTRDVAPGDTITFDLPLVAPATPGSAGMVWRVVQGTTWVGEATPKQTLQVAP